MCPTVGGQENLLFDYSCYTHLYSLPLNVYRLLTMLSLYYLGLLEACKPVGSQHLPLKPVFLLDPWFVENARVGVNR